MGGGIAGTLLEAATPHVVTALESVRVEEASALHGPKLAELFERVGVPCYCRYWHFQGDRNAWLARCAAEPDVNRTEMLRAIETGSDAMNGVVAVLPDDTVIGWLKLARAQTLRKVYEQKLYKGLPCFDGDRARVFSIGCLLVDERYRRLGTARRLLGGAIAAARRRGARAIEAFPRRDQNVSDAALFMGPESIYVAEGFESVHEIGPYPVLRLDLR